MSQLSPLVRFLIAFLLLLLVIGGGTIGYSIIEGWSLQESVYMTFITITTVGFQEVRPLSPEGRHFTILLLLFSFLTLGYSATTLITFIFEGQILQAMRERKMKRMISKLKDHYIICGCGDVGREVALELKRAGEKFVVIDRNPGESELARDESILFVEGDAVEEEVLKEAQIEKAKGLISALPEDKSNVFVVLSARELNPGIRIVSQAEEDGTVRKLQKAGANRVISPKRIAGQRMASIILRPSVVNFLDVVVDRGEMSMRIEEIRVNKGSPLVGKNLKQAEIGQHTGAIVVGINDSRGHTRINPSAHATISDIPIKKDDVLIAMGNEDQIKKLKDFVQKRE